MIVVLFVYAQPESSLHGLGDCTHRFLWKPFIGAPLDDAGPSACSWLATMTRHNSTHALDNTSRTRNLSAQESDVEDEIYCG